MTLPSIFTKTGSFDDANAQRQYDQAVLSQGDVERRIPTSWYPLFEEDRTFGYKGRLYPVAATILLTTEDLHALVRYAENRNASHLLPSLNNTCTQVGGGGIHRFPTWMLLVVLDLPVPLAQFSIAFSWSRLDNAPAQCVAYALQFKATRCLRWATSAEVGANPQLCADFARDFPRWLLTYFDQSIPEEERAHFEYPTMTEHWLAFLHKAANDGGHGRNFERIPKTLPTVGAGPDQPTLKQQAIAATLAGLYETLHQPSSSHHASPPPKNLVSTSGIAPFVKELTAPLQTAVLHSLVPTRPDVLALLDAVLAGETGPSAVPLSVRLNALHKQELLLRKQQRCAWVPTPKAGGVLLPVWSAGLPWTIAPPCDVFRECHTMEFPPQRGGQVPPRLPAGSPMVVSQEEFTRNWAVLTNGTLKGFDWTNVVAAGGAVHTCLTKHYATDEERIKGLAEDPTVGPDIDLFIVGPLRSEVYLARLQAILNHFVGKYKDEATYLWTTGTLTIVLPHPAKRIQVGIGMAESLFDILLFADVDAAAVGFDGSGVFMTPRSYLAFRHRVNVPRQELNRVRASPTYEKRLLKYAQRGFAVLNLRLKKGDPRIAATTASFPSPVRLLPLSGFAWMHAVQQDLSYPRTTRSGDALAAWDRMSGKMTMAQLRRLVESTEYQESDNYGSHEEGYVLLSSEGSSRVYDNHILPNLLKERVRNAVYNLWIEATLYPADPWLAGLASVEKGSNDAGSASATNAIKSESEGPAHGHVDEDEEVNTVEEDWADEGVDDDSYHYFKDYDREGRDADHPEDDDGEESEVDLEEDVECEEEEEEEFTQPE